MFGLGENVSEDFGKVQHPKLPSSWTVSATNPKAGLILEPINSINLAFGSHLLPGDGILHWSKSDHLNKAVPRESPHQGVSSHLSNGPKPLGQGLLTAHLLALIHRPNDQTNCRDGKGFDKLSDSVRAISMLNLLCNCIHTLRMTIAGVVIVSAAAVFHLQIGTSVTSSSYSPSQAVIAGVWWKLLSKNSCNDNACAVAVRVIPTQKHKRECHPRTFLQFQSESSSLLSSLALKKDHLQVLPPMLFFNWRVLNLRICHNPRDRRCQPAAPKHLGLHGLRA